MSKVRNSNLEVLRIISMVFIIFMHCTLFGFDIYAKDFSFNKVILEILFSAGKIGVNCFILISGYFMIKSNITFKKVFKIVFEVWFYSICIMIIGLIFMEKTLDFNSFLQFLFPIIHGNYWFITCYMLLYLMIPFINKCLLKFGKDFHKKMLFALLIIWCIIPTFIFNATVGYSDFGWFIVLYLIGSYIRLYYKNDNKYKFGHFFLKASVYFAICLILTIGIDFLAINWSYFQKNSPGITSSTLSPYFVHFLNMNSLPLLLASINLFLAFLYLKMKPYKFINLIASTTFGIYIIHEHLYLKYFIWGNVFKNSNYYTDVLHVVFSAFSSVFILFIVCSIIDIIRQFTAEKIVMKFFDKYYSKVKENVLKSAFISRMLKKYNTI